MHGANTRLGNRLLQRIICPGSVHLLSIDTRLRQMQQTVLMTIWHIISYIHLYIRFPIIIRDLSALQY